MPRRPILVLALAAALALSACGGGGTPAEPTVAPLDRPTSTPRPTVTPKPAPTEAPDPTEAPRPTATPKALATPVPTSTGGELAPVEIDGFEEYTHPGGLFTLQVPTNWTIEDNSNEAVAAVTWTDPNNNALVIVLVSEEAGELSQDELAQRLQDFVDTSKDEPEFSADDPQYLDNGGVQIIWGYDATADGGVVARLLVNSFIYQNGDKISILMLGVPSEQFDGLKDSLDTILGSYTVDPSVALGVAAIDDNLPGGETYDFSDDKGAWVTETTDAVESLREGGVYTMRIFAPNQYYISNPDMDIGTEQGIAANVEPGGDSRAGVFLRLSKSAGKSSFYTCWIDAQSQYGCFVSDQGEWTTLQDATESDAISPGVPNRIRMTAYGDEITFSVNGVELLTLTDDRLTEGRAGLYLENFEDPVEAIYDDVVIQSE